MKDKAEANNLESGKNTFIKHFQNYAPFYEVVIGVLGLAIAVFGVFAFTSVVNINKTISAQDSIIAEICNFYGTDDKTMASELYEAQVYFEAQKYSEAARIYTKYLEKSSIACLNFGYLYSKGLGVKQDFDTANTYYKRAYEMGSDKGMSNYVALNLLYPNGFNEVSSALKYGINHGYVKSMLFAAYFESGTMYAEYSQKVFELAIDFINRPLLEQASKMKDKLYLYDVDTEKTLSETIPESTDFIKYSMIDKRGVQPKEVKIISILEFTGDNEPQTAYVPVADYDIVYYYSVCKYHFHCSDELLSEDFCYALVE